MGVASVGAGLRPGAPALRARRRHGGRPGAGADADRRGDLAPQQPRRAAGAVLRRAPCGSACARSRTGARAGWCSAAWASGLGFEAKMAVALMVVPGIVAAYLWIAPRGRARRAWASCSPAAPRWRRSAARGRARVAMTPAADRPWVSGTADNSIWSLIFGYNGLGRLVGQAGGPAAARRRPGRRWRRPARCSAVPRRHAAGRVQPRRPGGLVDRRGAGGRRRPWCWPAGCAAATPAAAG